MSLLVTGGHGFVMSNAVRYWLERYPDERVVIIDRDPPDAVVNRFLAPVADRIDFIQADILDRATWYGPARAAGVDRILHGAALTPHPFVDAEGRLQDPERTAPENIIDTNLGGTLASLTFARELAVCRRFVLVSTASIYADETHDPEPRTEEAEAAPRTLYGISKFAAELLARRYAELFGLPVVAARLASVYGPLDRVLASRHVICTPNRVTALALAGEPIRIQSLDCVGDFIHARDVATALAALLSAGSPGYPVYNIGSGRVETFERLARLTAELVPGATWLVDQGAPNVSGEPGRRLGQWGAYAISRMIEEFGWQPLSLDERLAEYLGWRRREEIGISRASQPM
jgi:UDP-glucose 4-epimerase